MNQIEKQLVNYTLVKMKMRDKQTYQLLRSPHWLDLVCGGFKL
jgi:hypothetical protein